jgi:hypothetical protein
LLDVDFLDPEEPECADEDFPEEEPAADFAMDDLDFVPADEDLADDDLADDDLADELPALVIDFDPDEELALLGLADADLVDEAEEPDFALVDLDLEPEALPPDAEDLAFELFFLVLDLVPGSAPLTLSMALAPASQTASAAPLTVSVTRSSVPLDFLDLLMGTSWEGFSTKRPDHRDPSRPHARNRGRPPFLLESRMVQLPHRLADICKPDAERG